MIQLVGGKLYQWDTGRIVQIESGNSIHEVHFTTPQMKFAYVVNTYDEGENTYCAIPNVIIQSSQDIYCYAVKENNNGEETVSTMVLSVTKRNRPDDYVYTEPERLAFKELEQRIDETAEQIKTIPYIITGTLLGSTSVTLNDFSWEELKTTFADNRPVFIVTKSEKKTPLTNVYTLVRYKEIGVPPYAEFTRSANGYVYTLKVTSDGSTTLTSNNISIDETLTIDGAPADAKTVGDKFTAIDVGTNTNIVSTNEQILTDAQKKQARENIGIVGASAEIVPTDAKYFDIDLDGVVSLKSEYRGTGDEGYSYSISDNGLNTVGSKNAELPKNIVIPDTINEIAVTAFQPGMFSQNRIIMSLTIPSYIEEIPDYFCNCAYNLEDIGDMSNVKKIGNCAFQRTSITKALFPRLEVLSGNRNFAYNTYMTMADIGDKITTIPERCFRGCMRLSYLRGGASVTEIQKEGMECVVRLKNLPFASQLTHIGVAGLHYSRVNYDWKNHTNCTFDTAATYAQNTFNNGDEFWKDAIPTSCENFILSTFNQADPDNQIGDEVIDKYSKNCMCCDEAMIYSAYTGEEIPSAVPYIQAVKKIDPTLLDIAPNSPEGIEAWMGALGYTVEHGTYTTKDDVQKVYDALAAGHLVCSECVPKGSPYHYGGHAIMFYGINSNGEVMAVDSIDFSYALEKYDAIKFAMPIGHMIDKGCEYFIVK